MEWNARILVLPFVTFWSIPRGSNAYSITSSTYKRDPTHHFCHQRNACFKGIHDWTTYVGCASSLIMPNPSGRIESKFASDYPFRMCSVFIVLFEIEILALSRLVGYTVFANKCSIVIYRCMYILFHWFLFLLYMRVRVAVPFGCLCLHVIRENEFPAKRKKAYRGPLRKAKQLISFPPNGRLWPTREHHSILSTAAGVPHPHPPAHHLLQSLCVIFSISFLNSSSIWRT